MGEVRPGLSRSARRIINEMIVRDGLSYVDAAKRCDDLAVDAAYPFREAAAEIRRWSAGELPASGAEQEPQEPASDGSERGSKNLLGGVGGEKP